MQSKKEILYWLSEFGELTERILTRQLSISNMNRPRYYVALHRLETQGLVKKKKLGRKIVSVRLTEKGREYIKKPSQKLNRSDGFSTIVLFDIPEEKHLQRNLLRRYLQKNGYTLMQRSVLIAPYKVTDQLLDLLKELDLTQYVKIISGKIEHIL